jgi:hypothetical protein
LIYGSEQDRRFQELAAAFSYHREKRLVQFARGVFFDVTQLLPYLYDRFALQVGQLLFDQIYAQAGLCTLLRLYATTAGFGRAS